MSATPFTSIEVRWFFAGDRDRSSVRAWFEACSPLSRATDVGRIEWATRKDDEPDTYLLLPGYENMGIKWREGTLQVKGLVADAGDRSYADRHHGRVQRWIKWTYGRVPAAVQDLFGIATEGDRVVVPVRKLRAVRLVEIGPTGELTEVPSSKRIRQGVAFEMTGLEIGNRRFFTIAFEGFPDSSSLRACFDDVAGRFLQELEHPCMALDRSWSYPAWLNRELG